MYLLSAIWQWYATLKTGKYNSPEEAEGRAGWWLFPRERVAERGSKVWEQWVIFTCLILAEWETEREWEREQLQCKTGDQQMADISTDLRARPYTDTHAHTLLYTIKHIRAYRVTYCKCSPLEIYNNHFFLYKCGQKTNIYITSIDALELIAASIFGAVCSLMLVILFLNQSDTPPPPQAKLIVPNSTAGLIIGKGGATVKAVMEQSGAWVQLSQKPEGINLQERVVTVSGEPEQNRKAVEIIVQKIRRTHRAAAVSISVTPTSQAPWPTPTRPDPPSPTLQRCYPTPQWQLQPPRSLARQVSRAWVGSLPPCQVFPVMICLPLHLLWTLWPVMATIPIHWGLVSTRPLHLGCSLPLRLAPIQQLQLPPICLLHTPARPLEGAVTLPHIA